MTMDSGSAAPLVLEGEAKNLRRALLGHSELLHLNIKVYQVLAKQQIVQNVAEDKGRLGT